MQLPPDNSVDWTPLMDEQRSEGCAARPLMPPRKRVARAMTAPGSIRMNFTTCQSNVAEPAYRQHRRKVSSQLQSDPAEAVPARLT
ncbi:hypothetical protein WJX82_002171 [Trebouxia sp. C0006]